MRGGRRRRKSSSSKDTDQAGQTRSPSYANSSSSPTSADVLTKESPALINTTGHRFGVIEFADDIDNETLQSRKSRTQSFIEKNDVKSKKERKHRKKHRHKKKSTRTPTPQNEKVEDTPVDTQTGGFNEPRRVDFAVQGEEVQSTDPSQKKPFSLRGISIRPTIPKTFSQNVFTQPPSSAFPHQLESAPVTGPIPSIRYGIRRTNSLPDHLNRTTGLQGGIRPISNRPITTAPLPHAPGGEAEENISRTTAVLLLLFSTALVSVCANFMVDSIDSVTQNTALGETFVGLILLPIVGNAAEHVTAVTVASKNKMDLAIGVAVGSSIQIGRSNNLIASSQELTSAP
jgi:Ca2+:H+ antiporter